MTVQIMMPAPREARTHNDLDTISLNNPGVEYQHPFE